jgi:hypothetical protein
MIRSNVTPCDRHWPRRGLSGFTCVLLAMGLLATAGASAATKIYRTVDEDGNVVFTDVPPKSGEQGEAVDLNQSNTFTPPQRQDTGRSLGSWRGEGEAAGDGEEPGGARYRAVSVASPANDADIRDNAGNVTIGAAIDPELHSGHAVQLYLDGELQQSAQGTSFRLTNIDRGTHSVELRIVDQAGNTVAASAPSTFHLQRRSVLTQPAPRPRGSN